MLLLLLRRACRDNLSTVERRVGTNVYYTVYSIHIIVVEGIPITKIHTHVLYICVEVDTIRFAKHSKTFEQTLLGFVGAVGQFYEHWTFFWTFIEKCKKKNPLTNVYKHDSLR